MSTRIAGLCLRHPVKQSNLPGSLSKSLLQNASHTRKREIDTASRLSTRPSISRTWGLSGKTFSRGLQTQRYQPFVPPSPESLGKAAPAKQYKRSIKWSRRLLYVTVVGGTLYFVDKQFYASAISRSLKTFGLGIMVAADYKINFRPDPWFGGSIVDLHHRNAERLFNLLHSNGGLYLKIGQAIAMQSAVLPPEFQKVHTPSMLQDCSFMLESYQSNRRKS